MSELKNCPFCEGLGDYILPNVYSDETMYDEPVIIAECPECKLRTNPAHTLQEAISNWNNEQFCNVHTLLLRKQYWKHY